MRFFFAEELGYSQYLKDCLFFTFGRQFLTSRRKLITTSCFYGFGPVHSGSGTIKKIIPNPPRKRRLSSLSRRLCVWQACYTGINMLRIYLWPIRSGLHTAEAKIIGSGNLQVACYMHNICSGVCAYQVIRVYIAVQWFGFRTSRLAHTQSHTAKGA